MMTEKKYPVIFSGAGPGDPELITVKGMKALENADLIIYAGSLVPEAVLKWAKEDTTILNSASMHLEEIIIAMSDAINRGERVVRLHTGDPALYGAIYEQMKELDKLGITYKVIPGVTAAFAAAASMGIEYTLPEVTQTLILTRMAGRTPVPEAESLDSLAKHQASMSIYLSITLIDKVAEILIKYYGGESTCAIAFRVSQPEERIIYCPLNELEETVKKENINHQALIIVGKSLDVKTKDLAFKSKLYDKGFTHDYRTATDLPE